MKKVLVCALAVFFLLASCSTAFAEELSSTTTTTTTYVVGDPDKMTVTTTVDGGTEGYMYTFMATEGAINKASDGDEKTVVTNVVYADQQTYKGEPLKFEYTGSTESFVTLNTYSGSNEPNREKVDVSGLARRVEVTFVGMDTDTEWDNVTLTLPRHEATVPFNVDVPYNKKIESVTWNNGDTVVDLEYTNGVITNSFADGAVLTVNLTDATAEDNDVDEDSFIGKTFWRKNGNEVLTVFAKIKSLMPGTKFGVKIYVDGECIGTFAAIGAGSDGSFAVQLINEDTANGSDFTGKDVKASVYYGDEETAQFDVEPASYEG